MKGFFRYLIPCVAVFFSATAIADPAGEIVYVDGVGTIQSAGQAPQILGKGIPVNQGDIITTAEGTYVLIKYADGTRMTVRPESQLIVHTYQFNPVSTARGASAMVFDLLKGGLRTITGLISKHDSGAASIHTATATIGIRGTDLDLRLCNGDCAREQIAATGKRTPRLNSPLASARVVALQGTVSALGITGIRHDLLQGSPVYPGDTIETGASSYVVLGFRDESKVTIQARTSTRVEDFVFDERNPEEGRFLMNLIRGGLRAFTGIIGHANHDHVGIYTPTATVGIRGTGIDLFEGESGDFAGTTWEGLMAVTQTQSGDTVEVQRGQTACFRPNEHIHFIGCTTSADGPRPDSVPVDWHQLFGRDAFDGTESGVWMYVRQGPVHVDSLNGHSLDAGDHEVLYFDYSGQVYGRPILIPLFFDSDDTPDPTQAYHFNLINEIKPSGIEAVCKR